MADELYADNHRIAREKGWPAGVRVIGMDNLDDLGVKDGTDELFWKGKPVETRHRVSLRRGEFILAAIVAAATVVQAAFAALTYFTPPA